MNHEKVAQDKVKRIISFKKRNPISRRIVPSTYSIDPVERSLGCTLRALKQAKNKGTGHSKFYPSLQRIVEINNLPTTFDYINNKQKAIIKATAAFEWIKEHGKAPTESTAPDHYMFLRNLKPIKLGLLQGVWYPELDEIAKSYGHDNFFGDKLNGVMINVDITDLMKHYKKHNKLPSQLSENKEERDLYRKLIRLKQIKQGKTVQIWNPELDVLLRKDKMRNFFN